MNILIILGFKLLPNNKMSQILINRLDKGAKLFKNISKKYNNIIVSGGRVEKRSSHSEAYLMKKYLIHTHNIPKHVILTESNSIDTIENAVYCMRILQQIKHITSIDIVSSKFHIKRVRAIFSFYLQKYKQYTQYIYSNNALYGQALITRNKNEKKYLTLFLQDFGTV